MRFEGVLTTWNEEQGFGLIAADQGGQDIVVGQSALRGGPEKVRAGQRVSFEIEPAAGGYKKARNVAITPSRREVHAALRRQRRGVGPASVAVLPLFLLVFLITAVTWSVPSWIALAYAGLSAVTAITYGMDRQAAERNLPRVSESTLLMMALAGGWPGALLAMQILRHKTAKPAFQAAFWIAVFVNVVGFVVWVSMLRQPVGR